MISDKNFLLNIPVSLDRKDRILIDLISFYIDSIYNSFDIINNTIFDIIAQKADTERNNRVRLLN